MGEYRRDVGDISGSEIAPGTDDESVLKAITNLDNLKVYGVKSPSGGTWTLSVTSSVAYSISVTANSPVDFTYHFVEAVGGTHPGYRPIDGRPLGGKLFEFT